MKARIIVADPPWMYNDKLRQSSTKRGAEDQYESVMTTADIKALPVEDVAMKDSMLVLWVTGTHVADGLEVMKEWGFAHKQIFCWVKSKKNPLESLLKGLRKNVLAGNLQEIKESIINFNINNILNFYMGHYFRQTHEIALVGVRGKLSQHIKNKSQRSVFIAPIDEHSDKPEGLQDSLEAMFEDDGSIPKLELFGRRLRKGWTVLGNECPDDGTGIENDKDIRISLNNLINTDKPTLVVTSHNQTGGITVGQVKVQVV